MVLSDQFSFKVLIDVSDADADFTQEGVRSYLKNHSAPTLAQWQASNPQYQALRMKTPADLQRHLHICARQKGGKTGNDHFFYTNGSVVLGHRSYVVMRALKGAKTLEAMSTTSFGFASAQPHTRP